MSDEWNNREEPQAREPFRCLNGQSYRKTGQRSLLINSYKRLEKKDSERAITPVVEADHVPAHLAPPGSPQAKQLHHLHAQLSLGQSCHRQKKSYIYVRRVASVVSTLCDPVDCGLPGFSVREGFPQAGILEHIGQYWLPYPSTALYFLLP